jgi:hypothetical protein
LRRKRWRRRLRRARDLLRRRWGLQMRDAHGRRGGRAGLP